MKKKYFKPEMESMVVNTAWLMQQPGSDTAASDSSPLGPPVPNPAPGKLF